MLYALISVTVVLLVVAGVLTWQLFRCRTRLSHFSKIADVEAYRNECEDAANQATLLAERSKLERQAQQEAIEGLKKQVTQYQQVVADFKSAADLKKYVKQMSDFAQGCKTLGEIAAKIQHQEQLLAQLQDDLKRLGFDVTLARSAGNIEEQIQAKKQELSVLRKELAAIEEIKDLQEFGYYRRKYDFDSAEKYKNRLDGVLKGQKDMIKRNTAATCGVEWTVEGSKTKGKKMVKDKIKLLLRAFNGECDAAIAKVAFSNATAMETRIKRSFDQISKMGEVSQVHISTDYLNLKLQELYLAHEYQLQKYEEREEQRQIKQMMKEEAKVERELKRAQEDAERDEKVRRDALERARQELAAREGIHTEKLAALVEKLERELSEAIDRKAKAIARAQLTKSGHVYVLSNEGSFGMGVYKIGMTRRLEPLERVSELASASVPFLFDVHAMIYSENAPALEAALHRHFNDRRVNLVNMRKEFFRVTLDEIQAAVAEHFGTVTWILDAEAREYRETMALHAERMQFEDAEAEGVLVA